MECCLTSNAVLGAVPSLKEHPIRSLVDAGIPLTLSSDDPVSLDTTIGIEYELAAGLEFDAFDLLGFTCNGISASFTSAERKTASCRRSDSTRCRVSAAPIDSVLWAACAPSRSVGSSDMPKLRKKTVGRATTW